MNPQEAFNMMVNAVRQLKLSANEHDQLTQAALVLKPIVEKHISESASVNEEAKKEVKN